MTTFHVSPQGSDQNPGTTDAPLASLHGARERVRSVLRTFADGEGEDITVRLLPGVHRLTETLVLGPEDGGDSGFTVTWEGTSEEGATVSSGLPLTDWRRCEEDPADVPEELRGRVWYIDLPAGSGVRCLFGTDGEIPRARGPAIQPEMRTPNDSQGPGDQYGPDGPLESTPPGKADTPTWFHDRFGYPPEALPEAEDLEASEFVIIPRNQWTMNILPFGGVDRENRVVHLDQPCTYPIGIPHCAPEGSIWLENSLSVLSPGTWVYNANTSRLYFCPEGERPEEGMEAACLTEFIRLEGLHEEIPNLQPVQGIRLRNLTFTRGNRYTFHGLTGRGIQHDWEMHDAATCMVRLRHAHGCAVEDCHFLEAGSGGLRMDLACRGNQVERCTFARLGGCGVVLCGYGLSRNYLNRENRVADCHFHHLGRHYWHCPAVFIWQSGDNHIAANHLHDLPYTAIVCSGRTVYDRKGKGECSATIDWDAVEAQCGAGYVHNVWHYSGLPNWWMREPLMHSRENLIEYNHIHDVMQVMGDGNGIYISGAGGGNVVRYNVVGPCPSPTMSEGLRCDDDQHHTILHGNLVFAQAGSATGITLKGVNRVTNNILALPLNTPVRGVLSLETGPLNGSVIERNIILTSAPEERFVNDKRIHGQGRKARLRDTDSDHNLYFCTSDPEAGRAFLENARSFSTDRNSLSTDPGFVDAEKHDFHLKPDAAALKTGFEPLPLDRMFQT